MSDRVPSRGFHLLDLSAIVIGYGMAALLIRAFWPSGERPPLAEMAAIGLVYCWLGLAMSGPLVLLIRRPDPPATAEPGAAPARDPGARTWAELAWLIIGFYWIGLTTLVVPVRLHRSPLHDATLIGLLPIVAAVVLCLFDRSGRHARSPRDPHGALPPPARAWTHHAAIGLLLSWPLTWIALVLLGKSLL